MILKKHLSKVKGDILNATNDPRLRFLIIPYVSISVTINRCINVILVCLKRYNSVQTTTHWLSIRLNAKNSQNDHPS